MHAALYDLSSVSDSGLGVAVPLGPGVLGSVDAHAPSSVTVSVAAFQSFPFASACAHAP